MFNVFKKVTSAVVAGAVVLGTLAVYPNITKGKGSTAVSAAELPAVQEAASAVNYSSILGRGVDYGIIADNFQQRMHMQSTYAVKSFSTTCAGTPSEVNLTQDGSVAQFLVGGIVSSGEVVFGQTVSGPPYVFVGGDSTNILNFEGAAEVFATEPGQTQSNFKSQNFASEVLTTNTNTNGNIDLIMGDAFDSSASITAKAGSSAYAIDYHDYFTENDSTHGTLNLDTGDFVNRVVYINVDNDLMNKISQSDGLKIIKDSSTVIVFNVGQDVSVVTPYYNESGLFGRFIAFNTYNVSVDGGANWIRTTSSTSKDKATRDLDREVCQKVIWNITTTKDVGLDATAGLFIIPNAYTDVVGSSAGWVVANNLSNTRGEWHYIYGGGNQNILDDEQGEIHFAARKTFTHEWDGEDTRDHEDTTIFTEAGKYSFYWYENDSSFSIDNPKDLDPSEYDTISNEATNKLLFPKLHFYNNEDKARTAGELDHYIPVNTDKTFYYTIREVGAGDKTSDGIELSTGYINITLTVKNVNGDLGYYVYSETYLGDGTFYERNAGVDENGDFIMNGSEYTQTRMSGVEFFLGEFFNLVDNALTLKKTVTGDYTPVAGDTFTYYVVNKADNKYYFLDSNNEIASSTEKVGIPVEYGKEVLLSGLPAGEYTVSEDRYLAQRREYELNDPSAQDVTVNDSRVPVVNLVNDYTFNEDVIGKILLTKTFEGIVTQEDLTGIKFTVSDKNGVIWEHKLGDSVFTVTKDQATGDIKYEAVIENLNISEDYKVVETMTVPEGYTFEKVSYVTGTDAEQPGFETNAFKPLPDGINVDYKDVYNRITGKLIVDKNLKDKEGKAITGFDNETFTFRVKAGDAGYLQKDGTIGTDPYEFTITAGENANITVDYSAFNMTLTVEELDPNGVVIAGYDFVEDKYTNNGKSFGYPANDITIGIDNYYDFSTTPTGNIVITKTIEGPVTEKDIEGLTFEIYKVGETTPVWTGSLKETTGTSPKFIVDSTSGVYTSETITVETGEYYVVEKLTTDEGTVTVTYKINNTDGNVNADYANKTVSTETFGVAKDVTTTLSFVNAYEGASLKINKTVTGKVKNNNFSFTVLGADGNYYNASGNSTGTTPSHITVVGGESITIGNLPVQEYTVEETAPANNAADKWTFDADGSTQKVTKTVSTSSTVEADLDNIYTEIVPDTGKIVITKTIEGPVTEKDIEGLTFEVYKNGETTPVWTGSLKETTGSSPKFTVDSNGVYTSEEIEVETGKYYVVEKLTTDEGTVTVSYKIDNVDGRVTADYENKTVKTQTFDVDKAADKALTFVNTYTGADLKISKTVTGNTKIDSFDVTVKGADGNYYNSNGESTGSTATYITVPSNGDVTVGKLPVQEYTVEEVDAAGNAADNWTFDSTNSTQSGSKTVSVTTTEEVKLNNIYIENAPDTGKIVITKTIEGPVTEQDIEGLTFEIYKDADTTNPIWTGSLKETTGTAPKFTVDSNGVYTSEEIEVETGNYYVVEKLTTEAGTVKVSYTLDNTTGKPIADYANKKVETASFDVTKGNTSELAFKNTYVGADLKINKSLTGTAKSNTFVVTVKGADGNYYNASGKSTGSTATNIDVTVGSTVIIPDLPIQEYTVEEVGAAANAEDGWTFDSTASTQSVSKTIAVGAETIATLENIYTKDAPDTSNIVITKTIEGPVTEKDIEGLTFEVYKEGDTTPVWTGSLKDTTGSAPKFTVDASTGNYVSEKINVETGKYYVVEKLTTDEGTVTVTYKLDNVDGTVTADYANKTVKTETFDVTKDADKALTFVNTYVGADLKISKTVTGNTKVDSFDVTVKGADGNYYDAKGNSTGSTATTITVPSNGDVTVGKLPVQEYTVEEVDAAGNAADGWTFDSTNSAQSGSKTVSVTTTEEVKLNNIYTKNAPDTSNIVITKTIEGPVTEKDIEGLTFEVYSVNDTTTPVWTGTLKETTGSSPKFTIDASTGDYVSEKINVETGKYYVVEKLTTDEGTVTVTYKVDNKDGNVTADYANKTVKTETFDVTKAADTALTFVNTYVGADLKISKALTGTAKSNTFAVTVKGADGNYYNASGKSTGATATNIDVTVGSTVIIPDLPIQEYTVEEVGAAANAEDGWTFDAQTSEQSVTKTIAVNTETIATVSNVYTKNEGNIVITKTIEGPVTEKDIEGLTFEVYKEGATTPVWTGTLKETTGSSPKFTVDASTGNYVSEKINVETGKYYVVEKLTTDEGTVTVTYKVDNTDGTVTADYANKNVKTETFDVTKDATTALSFVNAYVGADLKISKELTGSSKTTEFKVTVKGADGNYYDAKGNSTGSTATQITVSAGSSITVGKLPVQEYTVAEVGAAANAEDGWSLDSKASTQSVKKTVDVSTTAEAKIVNVYTQNAPEKGDIVITKTIEGPVTEKDIEGLTFEVYMEGEATPVWTGTLKETTGSSPKFTIDASTGDYVSEKITVDTGKYYVVEKLTTDEGTVTVTYKVDNTDGTVTADYANKTVKTETFDVNKDATTALTFVNAYVGADLKINKSLTGTAKSNTFVVTVKGADGNYYNASGKSTGATATNIDVTVGSTVIIPDLPVQEYTVEEVNAAGNAEDGWTFDAQTSEQSVTKTIAVNTETIATVSNVYTKDAPDTSNIVITKTIEGPVTDKDIEGLTFEVYSVNDTTTPVWTGSLKETTGSAPKFTVDASTGNYVSEKINVETGKYYVVEKLTTDEGTVTVTYKLDNVDGTVTADYVNKTVKTETFDVTKDADKALTFVNTYVGADLKISKTVTGNTKVDSFDVTVKGADGNYYDAKGNSTGSTATTITVPSNGDVTVGKLPVQEYTVEEVNPADNAADGWTFDSNASTKSDKKTVSVTSTVEAKLDNIYTENAPETGDIVITKTIEGPVTEKDIEGLTFEVYNENDTTTPVWTGTLKETTGTAPKFTVDSKGVYTSEKISVDEGTYYVVEKLTTDEGTVTVTYKVDNTDGTVTADYANKNVKTETFDVTKGSETALSFVNAYVGGSLKINKTLTGSAKTNTFTVTVKGANGNYYNESGKSTGTTATNIEVTVGTTKIIPGLPAQDYTVEEVGAAANAEDDWSFDSTQSSQTDTKTVEAGKDATAQISNVYTKNGPETGTIVITKTIEGPVTEKDIEGLTFELYKEGDTSPVWTGTLKDTTGSSPKFTVDTSTGVYTSEKIGVETGKYYVVEKLTTDEGTVTVTYKVYNTDGTVTADYANKNVKTETFDVTKDAETALSFVNTYVGADLKIIKSVTGNTKSNSFKVTVKGADGNYYGLDGKSNGTTAVEINVPAGGSVTVGKLPVQEYTVEEIDAADNAEDGWTFDSKSSTQSGTKTVSVSTTAEVELSNVYTKNASDKSNIVITKTIEGPVTEKDIEGLTFELYKNGETTPVWTGSLKETTGTSPKFILDTTTGVYTSETISVDTGDYYVVEKLTTDEGTVTVTYKVNNTDGTVTADYANKNVKTEVFNAAEDETTTLSFVNTYVGASLKIAKTVTGSVKNNNFMFTILGADGNYYNADGSSAGNTPAHIVVEGGKTTIAANLPVQEYTISEVNVADNAEDGWTFDADNSTQKVVKTPGAGSVTEIELNNIYTENKVPLTGTINVTKTVAGTDPTGSTYTFTVKCGDEYVQDLTGTMGTDAHSFSISDGDTITITGLEIGKTYVVEEAEVTGLPSGIVCSTTYSSSNQVVLDNTTTTGTVDITNTFTDTNNYNNGSLKVTKLVTGSTSTELPTTFKFSVECDGQYVQQDGSLGTEKYLFEVTAGSDVTISNLDTDSKTYKVVEEEVTGLPTGYSCDEPQYSSQEVTLDSADDAGEVTITNNFNYDAPYPQPTTGSLSITKTIAGDVPAGSDSKTYSFTVTGPSYPNGTTITVTGASTETLTDLEPGAYTVTEDETGSAFAEYDLTVSGDNNVAKNVVAGETAEFGITNTYKEKKQPEPVTGKLIFTKTFGGDVTEEEAAGDNLYFVITNSAGEYLNLDGTFSTDVVKITLKDLDHKDGTRVWTATINVPTGTYTVKEYNDEIYVNGSNVPYKMDSSSVRTATASIDTTVASSLTGNLDLTNVYVYDSNLDVTLSKEDVAGKEIAQAQLTFTSLNGYDLSNVEVTQGGTKVEYTVSPDKHAISFYTVETAPSIIKGLRAGDYKLEETVTPKAYLTADAIVFTLLPDGTTECNGQVSVQGSPIVMVDEADPKYNTDSHNEHDEDSIDDKEPDSIPATGEVTSVASKIGLIIIALSAVCFMGYFVFKKTKKEETAE